MKTKSKIVKYIIEINIDMLPTENQGITTPSESCLTHSVYNNFRLELIEPSAGEVEVQQ